MPAAIPAAPLAESLVSFSCRGHARRYTSRAALNRSFLSLADDMPAAIPTAPLAESLVSFAC
jgi:hypothetical protein